MKAMQLQSPHPVGENPLRAVDVPTPTPGAREIRIAIRVCGVCHTDLHTVEGEIALPTLKPRTAHRYKELIDEGKLPMVGVNCFQDEDEKAPEMKFFRIGRPMIEDRIRYIREYRKAQKEGRSTADATRVRAAGCNASGRSNLSGWAVSSGERNASDIFGV